MFTFNKVRNILEKAGRLDLLPSEKDTDLERLNKALEAWFISLDIKEIKDRI